MGAFYVQAHVFPPSSGDSIRDVDYFNKHCDTFIKALKDPTVDICLQAIENVSEIVATYFDIIPAAHMDNIFNEFVKLASDESAKIRTTLYYVILSF